MAGNEINGLVFDLEAVPATEQQPATIIQVGGYRPDVGEQLEVQVNNNLPEVLARLDALSDGAAFILGHNILEHDLPLLRQVQPSLRLLAGHLPAIDTLTLSPLAFPQNPYHRLIKDYKLIRSSLNSPLSDCHATVTLFQDQKQAFSQLNAQHRQELLCYQSLLAPKGSGFEALFTELTGQPPLPANMLHTMIWRLMRETDPTLRRTLKVCQTRLRSLLRDDLPRPELHQPIAYLLAWLRVSGGNSVLAPWVRHQYPAVSQLVTELRDVPCDDASCTYCATTHDPRHELQRYFGFSQFREERPGSSLQRAIVLAVMQNQHVLAILATGGGKSLCYQLPALNRYHRNGSLTVIISPLQSLMKDQVDGLLAHNIQCAATLNGLLTMPERADVLEKIRMGDIGILLVSPEQFRNRAFCLALQQRQIGAWIFDEAHCLSKWGNDFRPDYLYASRFIREFSAGQPLAAIGCFTATAKPDVLEDIRSHFKQELGIRFREFLGTHERTNLAFDVIPCTRNEKWPLTRQLLAEGVGEGGAVVFVASRKNAEELAAHLLQHEVRCRHFHAGLPPGEKKLIQENFKAGALQVIVATNAFGMGVDKADVRLVLHADIPGSLENYLQEAGRAGRDQQPSRCILLYDPQDIESQFGMSERARLSIRDIKQILSKVRQESVRCKEGPLIITAGEILLDDSVDTSFSIDDRDAETKVTTAIAWLERGGFLTRGENHTRIFPAHVRLRGEEAERRLQEADLPARRREEYRAILQFLTDSPADERIDTDRLMVLTSQTHEEIVGALRQMEALQLIENDAQLTLYLRYGVVGSSERRLEQSCQLEQALFALFQESYPDHEPGGWLEINLQSLTAELTQRLAGRELLPVQVLQLLRSLSQDRDGDSQQRGCFELRQLNRDALRLQVKGGLSWSQIQEQGESRRLLAAALVTFLVKKLQGQRGKDLLVETTFGELADMIAAQPEIACHIPLEARKTRTEQVLLYLHQQEILCLNHGMTVMRRAMTLHVNPEKKGSYLKEDYARLDEHYREKRVQVHVMREYAEMALKEMGQALNLVLDYFSVLSHEFIQKYFRGREGVLKLATSEESWEMIVGNLNPVQKAIVADDEDTNRLVLAGPGSGKTRVIVHRIAYLLRVRRIPAASIIALTFNRHAANEIRQRLVALVGTEAYGLTILTYHSMAMRLTGRRLEGEQAEEPQAKGESAFDKILQHAVDLLEGKAATEEEGEDDLRERLLRGYRYILVDEYQDIDARQYRLVRALAGRRQEEEEEGRLCIMAVGDDDQNIYEWRGTDNRYIGEFEQRYKAKIDYLVENYRSSRHVINAANSVIMRIPERLKADYPIRINASREETPDGGRWRELDPDRQGRVTRLLIAGHKGHYANVQAQAALAELIRLRRLEGESSWDGCAVLARSHQLLEPVQAWCEEEGVPYHLAADGQGGSFLTREREFVATLEQIRAQPALPVSDLEARLGPMWTQPRWQHFFQEALWQLRSEQGEHPLPAATVVSWLYDYAREIRQQPKPGLYVGTVHSTKGLEFRHVVLLDGKWGSGNNLEEDRRLYYVGMTRAKETLTLGECERGQSYSRELAAEEADCRRYQASHRPELDRHYRYLTLKEVDIGFAGRQPASHAVHADVRALKPGDPLRLEAGQGGYRLLTPQGRVVGRTARAFELDMEVTHCEVAAICVRYASESSDPEKYPVKVDQWEVVVPRLWGQRKRA